MDYEHISEDLMYELENNEPSPLTEEERKYIELTREINLMNAQLTEIVKTLCILVSKISNLQTKLNLIDDKIILH